MSPSKRYHCEASVSLYGSLEPGLSPIRTGFRALVLLIGWRLLLVGVFTPAPAFAAGWPWPIFQASRSESLEASVEVSSARYLVGTGTGPSLEAARAEALQAIAIQLKVSISSSFDQASAERTTGEAQAFQRLAVQHLHLQSGFEQSGALSFATWERGGVWHATVRLDRAAAMKHLYEEEYRVHSAAFRVASTTALGSRDDLPRFTAAWRQSLKRYQLLREQMPELTTLAAEQASNNSLRQGAEVGTIEPLREVQARARGEESPAAERESLEAQATILAEVESDRKRFQEILAAGIQVKANTLVQVLGAEGAEPTASSPLETSIQQVGAVLMEQGIPVVQSGAAEVVLRLTPSVQIQRSAPGEGQSLVSCEVLLSPRMELRNGKIIPLGMPERALGRHHSDATIACAQALDLVTGDSAWQQRLVGGICEALPCEAGAIP